MKRFPILRFPHWEYSQVYDTQYEVNWNSTAEDQPDPVRTNELRSGDDRPRWKPMSIKSATRQIMDAILYEKESVAVPGHMSFFAGLIRMMPSKVWNKLYQVLGAVPQSPDKEMRQTLVYYDIVNESQ
ncbi:hypothetical protein AAG570_008764 [Ranatra chinensis]|uniref:Uncharacterized protein n=1 Tax=Ranatra chinensis TaxID=642074 RepID=A0ABD0Z2I9_9HEMI